MIFLFIFNEETSFLRDQRGEFLFTFVLVVLLLGVDSCNLGGFQITWWKFHSLFIRVFNCPGLIHTVGSIYGDVFIFWIYWMLRWNRCIKLILILILLFVWLYVNNFIAKASNLGYFRTDKSCSNTYLFHRKLYFFVSKEHSLDTI